MRSAGLVLSLTLMTATSAWAAEPMRPEALANRSGCMSCHDVVRKQVGPGFAQIAERYRNDKEAPARLAGKIRSGSVGTWGRVIMPRQSHVSEADAQTLAQWILAQPAR